MKILEFGQLGGRLPAAQEVRAQSPGDLTPGGRSQGCQRANLPMDSGGPGPAIRAPSLHDSPLPHASLADNYHQSPVDSTQLCFTNLFTLELLRTFL